MKKIIALFLLGACSVFGQEKTMLPNFTPPSPEAFKMTKYGDVPLDEFNGKVKLDVPLYQYTAGQLKLPLTLNYYGAGVKVDDLPTQVGINWSLDAGGVITREIRDKPDESGTRVNLTEAQVYALNMADCTPEAAQLRIIIENSGNDTEADVFRFNFLSYSGSFYLDDNFLPRLVKNDQNLKIEIIGNLLTDKAFVITDPLGVKYYFGGTDASESTQVRIITGDGPQLNAGGITSFYMYKIVHPIDGTILLAYDSLSPYEIGLNNSYSITRALSGNSLEACNSTSFPDQAKFSNVKNNIIDNKLLTRIYNLNNNEEILFNRTSTTNNTFRYYLDNIEIKRGSSLFSKINLEYSGLEDPATATRFFLTKIAIDKDIQAASEPNKKYEEYRMEYNSPASLPPRLSKKIDMLGYYNGKNNTTLVPCLSATVNCPDRTADFSYASKGVLSRIYYPTGGYTDFTYEPQPGVRENYLGFGGVTSINGEGPTVKHVEIPGYYMDENGVQQWRDMPNIGQTVAITLITSDWNGIPNHHAIVKLFITDITMGVTTTKNAVNGTPVVFNYTFDQTHTYKIAFDMQEPTSAPPDYGAYADFSFQYKSGYIATEGAGVRIKTVANFAGDIAESSKRYYYKPYHKLGSLFADVFQFSPRRSNSGYIKGCSDGGSGTMGSEMIVYSQTTYSDYIYSDFNCSAIKYKEYASVTVSYGGDNFEQGGIEKTFRISEEGDYFEIEPSTPRWIDAYQSDFPSAKHNNASLDGLVLKEKTFKNIDGAVYKVKENQYQYDYPVLSSKANFFGFTIYTRIINLCSTASTLSNFFIGGYYTRSYDYKKTSEKETLYIDPVPADIVPHELSEYEDPTTVYPTQEELEAPYKKITTSQSYAYGTLKGLPTVITSETSESGTVTSTRNYYADEATSISGLTPAQIAACSTLVSQNRIATPIQVEQYQNSELLSGQQTTYKAWNGIAGQVLPEFIRTMKGGSSTAVVEDRVIFTEYDLKGNPTILSMKDGTKTKYFYNDRNQVYLKVENYLTTQNIPAAPTWTDACAFMNTYPTAMITIYYYDTATSQITSMVAPNCQSTYYEYDSLRRLRYIKDNNLNILQEFDSNYKP